MANLFVERTIGLVRLLPPPIERVTLQGVDSTPNDSATGTLPRDSEGRRLFAAAFGRERIDRVVRGEITIVAPGRELDTGHWERRSDSGREPR